MKKLHLVGMDQLNLELHPEDAILVFIESYAELRRRPYHKTRLAFLLTNYRHFAAECEEEGREVRYLKTQKPIHEALNELEPGQLTMVEPAERELLQSLDDLIGSGTLTLLAHKGWLTTGEDLRAIEKDFFWKMDSFYRHVRKRTGVLMDGDQPLGGKFSFDTENRKPWRGDPRPPVLPEFEPDQITNEVVDLVNTLFEDNFGELCPTRIPQGCADAETLWEWAKTECLPLFGPYEDAMSSNEKNLFHTRISALLNVHRLMPQRVVAEVEELDIPIQSKEGFIRQVLGWREFVFQIHRTTDGFRDLPIPYGQARQDAGYWGWAQKTAPDDVQDGATPSALEAHQPLPPAFWGQKSGLNCLDTVVKHVIEDAYSHHITRLMILGNLATLLSIEPREITDWFWIAYIDSWDWVVEPNVLGMATYGTGPLFTTKPYVAGANYISKMSDFCDSCAFTAGKDCPVTRLYWNFLSRNQDSLADNPRLRPVFYGLKKRAASDLSKDQAIFEWAIDTLQAGGLLKPEEMPEGKS